MYKQDSELISIPVETAPVLQFDIKKDILNWQDANMRITKISLENFKCFRSLDMEMGKLTLLTGANSSGKSSVIYGILGALQSEEFPFQLSPNGRYADMGDFREISYGHSKDNTIKIEIGLDLDFPSIPVNDGTITTWWKEDRERKLPQLHRLETKTKKFEFDITKKRKYTIENINDYEQGTLDRKPLSSLTIDDLSVIINVSKNGGHGESVDPTLLIADKARLLFRYLHNKINFISSFRYHPQRTYYETTRMNLRVGKSGEDYINQLMLWQTGKAPEFEQLLTIMRELSLLHDIRGRRLEGGRFEMVVKVNREGIPASLNDVGFGISQFLPVIVADLQLGGASTLFVAQPEIHLHPAVQAQFGDYMVKQVQAYNKNYVIETHSEYLLNRVRLAIVKNEIPADDVTVYYLQNTGDSVQIHSLEFTPDGRILNAPEDFFRTYQMDVMNIAMGAVPEKLPYDK